MSTPRWITAAEVTDEEAGDVQGPDSSVDGNIALFDGTTGKLLKAAGVVEGVATIDSTTNILIGDGAGNAVNSGKPIGGDIPITLNPGDILAKDNNDNTLIELGDDGSRSSDYIPHKEDLSGYWSVRTQDDLPSGAVEMLDVHESGAIEINCLDGQEANPAGGILYIQTGAGFDDGNATPADGGSIFVGLGTGANGGADGSLQIDGAVSLSKLLKLNPLDDAPSPAEEGMIYADTDHHLYYYNGTTWKQLDNA